MLEAVLDGPEPPGVILESVCRSPKCLPSTLGGQRSAALSAGDGCGKPTQKGGRFCVPSPPQPSLFPSPVRLVLLSGFLVFSGQMGSSLKEHFALGQEFGRTAKEENVSFKNNSTISKAC